MNSFNTLGLSEPLLKGLAELGFETPSDIQAQAIPRLLTEDRDLIGLAQTGTGKTAAFGLPLLEKIDPNNPSTQALVLAPTRELGQQIAEQLVLFGKYMPKVNLLSVYGGASITDQMKKLRKQPRHVIIATPGRLLDLIRRKAIDLSALRLLVLDEADEMLNMGFKEDLDKILSFMPEGRLTWLFSATMPPEIKHIVNAYMTNPFEVRSGTKNEVNPNIDHRYAMVKHTHKTAAFCRFLDLEPKLRGVAFCRTKRDTQNLADALRKAGYRADALHGDLSQSRRDEVMKHFKQHHLQVLIATDVAARGIDVDDLTHVFHYSLPDDQSYYTHRSGRTARAGKKGVSLVFLTNREMHRINALQKQLKINFTKVDVPAVADIAEKHATNWCLKILAQDGDQKLNPAIVEEAMELFEPLTKEDIIKKLLATELEKLGTDQTANLNDTAIEGGGGGGGRGRKGYKGGGNKRKSNSNRQSFSNKFKGQGGSAPRKGGKRPRR